MTDDAFLLAFENCSLPKEFFNHQGHLRIAWAYLSKYVFEHALIRTSQGIFCFARSLGAKKIYHETLTRVWVHLVHKELHPKAACFADFITAKHHLLDKTLPFQYYSKDRLESELARKTWLEPDLKPLYE